MFCGKKDYGKNIYRDALFVVKVITSCETLEQINKANNLVSNFILLYPCDNKFCYELNRELIKKNRELSFKFWKESDERLKEILTEFETLILKKDVR